MKEKIFKNISLKVLSVVCAIFLWTVIVNIYDPTTSVTISNVTVSLINTESLTDKGYAYEVVDGNKIAVYVSGPKSIITDIKSSDIVATADMSKITAFADYVDIDVKVVKNGVTITNIEVTPKTTAIKLDIENRVTKEFTIITEVTGRPATGYVLLDKKVTPDKVKITGPASEIGKIEKVKAVCDVSGIKASTTKRSAIVMYDAEGNEIQSENLVMAAAEVQFALNIGMAKTVSVQCAGTEGKVANGYILTGATANVSEVTLVASDSSLLDQVTDIIIPTSAVNVNGLSENATFSVSLGNYVPKGVTFVANETVNISVSVEKRVTKQITITSGAIAVNNLKSGLTAKISGAGDVKITVSGTGSNLSKITAANIVASVDVSKLEAGTHSVVLNLSVNADCKIEGDYKVLVVIEDGSSQSRTVQE